MSLEEKLNTIIEKHFEDMLDEIIAEETAEENEEPSEIHYIEYTPQTMQNHSFEYGGQTYPIPYVEIPENCLMEFYFIPEGFNHIQQAILLGDYDEFIESPNGIYASQFEIVPNDDGDAVSLGYVFVPLLGFKEQYANQSITEENKDTYCYQREVGGDSQYTYSQTSLQEPNKLVLLKNNGNLIVNKWMLVENIENTDYEIFFTNQISWIEKIRITPIEYVSSEYLTVQEYVDYNSIGGNNNGGNDNGENKNGGVA